MIYYGKQSVNEDDIRAVAEVLRSPLITQGPEVERFERRVADYCGAKYAVAVTSATAALHIACRAADLGEGDELWTSPITFVASANCGLYCGAKVDFADVDADTYNISADALQKKLEAGGRPKVVVPVHLCGQSCDMERVGELSKEYGFTVIEDASHALGATYKGTKVGSCAYSDMAVFSFHPVKIITAGEGGMVLTNRKDLYEKLEILRTHAVTRNPALMTHEPDGEWYYQQIDLGYNYRMTDFQAALGNSQMNRLDKFVARRRELARRYDEAFRGLPLKRPYQNPDTNSSWHLYVVRVDFQKAGLTKGELFVKMRERGVQLNVHYIPVHTQPYYKSLGFNRGDFPVSEKYYDEAFTLPIYYDLTDAEQDTVISALRDALS